MNISRLFLFITFLAVTLSAQVAVKHMSGHAETDVVSIRPYVEIINEGNEGIELAELVVDYYIYEEGVSAADLTWEYYDCNAGQIYTISFFDLNEVLGTDDKKTNIKCEISFNAPYILAPGASVRLQHGIYKTGWEYTFVQSDDWSFFPNAIYTYNENIVVKNHTTGEVLYGNAIESGGSTNPRPYAVPVNWMGEHTFADFENVDVHEGDAFMNSANKVSYVYYQDNWTLLSDILIDPTVFATKEYVDNAVENVSKVEINNLLTQVKAINFYLEKEVTNGIFIGDYYAVRAILDANGIIGDVNDFVNLNADNRVVLLRLTNRSLTTIPAEIGDLTELTFLDLMGNNLTTLPAEIGNLTKLTDLYLNYNSISTLPMEIGNLSSLIKIWLHNNSISSLPSEFANLSNLSELRLGNNNISTIPTEIFNLLGLRELELSGNNISTLPAEIKNIVNLGILSLGGNNLTTLPAEIGNLTNLSLLGVERNALSSLPVEIGNLINLGHLYLHNNSLSTLPSEIENLVNIELAILDFNRLYDANPSWKAWADEHDPDWYTTQLPQ